MISDVRKKVSCPAPPEAQRHKHMQKASQVITDKNNQNT